MKFQNIKDLKKAIILLVVICSAISCGKEMYSCDKEADMWVKSNLTEIKQMSRVDFLAIGNLVYQRAAYNAFTPNQRQALWIDKIEKVLKLEWADQEILHIQKILELITKNSFIFSKDRDQEAIDKVTIEIYKWTEFAQGELGWDHDFLYAFIGTPQEMNADKTIRTDLVDTPSLKRGNECNCHYGNHAFIWCQNDDMGCYYYSSGMCELSSSGCGAFWLETCNGYCFR